MKFSGFFDHKIVAKKACHGIPVRRNQLSTILEMTMRSIRKERWNFVDFRFSAIIPKVGRLLDHDFGKNS